MGTIKVLPEIIANRIAAGEVIERPASIVKELVENSLDAGATSIEVAVRHGGKSLIRVADNGCGMKQDDAELAFLRHATSKIETAEDLNRILSFGFRGEALPSIAAVSRLKMLTRTAEDAAGSEIQFEGGKLKSAKEAACQPGTVIEVRDLFFNTPARRKFLKSDTTELGHVTDMISNLALSRLDVQFHFKAADRTVFQNVPGEPLIQRAATVLGGETASHLIEIEGGTLGAKVRGVIAKPRISRANRLGQILFVNGRCVKSYPFSYALQAGYHGLLMHGQYPVAVLFLELDPLRVDVNVHPTKQEVRISNEAQVKSLIKETVAAALAKEGDLAPDLKIPPAGSRREGYETPFRISEPAQISKNPELVETGPVFTVRTAEPFPEAVKVRNRLHITKVFGQIHQTFIVAETTEGFILIDQHAAHEKVQFEALKKSFESGKPAQQKLLMDEILEVTPRQSEILERESGFLVRIGFELEKFGEKTFVIRSIPAVFQTEHPSPLLKRFVEEIEDGKLKTGLENHQEELAALIACKRRSVKAHQPMNEASLRSLVEKLSECENPFCCPHGRPAFLKYTFDDLEKQFKRKK